MSKWNNGENTFLTGAAGTGKSWTIEHEIIEKYGDKCKIALTAMTGLASSNIKGQTIHSWLNLGAIRYDESLKNNLKRIMFKRGSKWEHVKNTDVLIIDEISMCDALTFDIINELLQWVKKSTKPFGGIQIILVGDNYQLPPVKAKEVGYYFQSDAYKYGNFKPYILKIQHRQSSGKFLDVLNRIRVGKCTTADIAYLNTRSVDLGHSLEVPDDTTLLFPENKEVDKINSKFLEQISEDEEFFMSNDVRLIPPLRDKKTGQIINDNLDKNLRAEKHLVLKRGCSVMLLVNLDIKKGLVNGSKGIYIGRYGNNKLLCRINGFVVEVPLQKFEVYRGDDLVFTREQYPLKLGYSVTIHKSQGMTLEHAFIDFSKVRTPHQAYVALSRVKSLEGLYVNGLDMSKVKVDKTIQEFMEGLEK